jgi:hypothetical protein
MTSTSISVGRSCVAAVFVTLGAKQTGQEFSEEGLDSGNASTNNGHVEFNDTPHESRGCGNCRALEAKSKGSPWEGYYEPVRSVALRST